MEQFVLGIFQEHLGKYIVGFRKEMVNANLLNGKGEIKDISLNCSAINEQLSHVTPFFELESIHISKLGFQVTSWTNLRKAPIVVDIEHITVHISEPLHYLYPRKRRRIRQMTVAEMERHFQELEEEAKKNKTAFSNPNNRGAYNLIDRIVDNLSIEIKSIYIQFQTYGKFKTRRPGPWTPPTIQFILRNLRFVSVDEYGQESTPEDIWNHNHQPTPRGQERTLLIFKRMSMDYDFGIRTSDGKQFSFIKGGGGLPPTPPATPAPSPPTKATAESPTAAETVAALAATTGPIEVPVAAPTAAETVAELAATTGAHQEMPSETQTEAETETERSESHVDNTGNSTKQRGADNENTKIASDENLFDDHNNQIEVCLSMKRRIRDGALLALQVDNVLSELEVVVSEEVVPYLVHTASGLGYCFCKDRGFEDPLRHADDHTNHNDSKQDFRISKDDSNDNNTEQSRQKNRSEDTSENSGPVAVGTSEAGAGDPSPSNRNSPEMRQETDVNGEIMTTNSSQVLKNVINGIDNNSLVADASSVADDTLTGDETEMSTLDDRSAVSQFQQSTANISKSFSSLFSKQFPSKDAFSAPPVATPAAAPFGNKHKHRAVIMLPNGLVIHEKISFSTSVERAIIRGLYNSRKSSASAEQKEIDADETRQAEDEQDGYVQLECKGAVFELIWPQANMEKGGYVQTSISQISIQERCGQRVRTIITGGCQQEDHTGQMEVEDQPHAEVEKDESFPKFHCRAIRDDPLDSRQTFPVQAVSLATTINYVFRKRCRPSRTTSTTPPATITTGTVDSILPKPQAKANTDIYIEDTTYDQNEDLIDVMKVTNEAGVAHLAIVLDCDSWCRALRFAMNSSGEGFDARWYTGDWTAILTTEMLVHPNEALELDNYIQPRAQLFLDENEFISSDLFNLKAVANDFEFRIPAAIHQNVRSCDLVVSIDETSLTISSDLPRPQKSGIIGKAKNENETNDAENEEIGFPNDPSDISYEFESSKDSSEANSSKPKSIFQFKTILQGFSTRIVPVIPFCVATRPQLLCAPTGMTVQFCFEGTPPETEEDNLVKMTLHFRLAVHHMYMNCDLDLIAGALSTCLYHIRVWNEMLERAKKLVPIFETSPDPRDDDVSFSNNESDELSLDRSSSRIKRSLRGHRVLVHRQFHRSRENGGLKIAFGLEVKKYAFALWRQNVSLRSPLRPSHCSANHLDRQRFHCPLMKLLSFSAHGVELGIEVAFREEDRRIVIKCAVSETQLSVCNPSGEDRRNLKYRADGEGQDLNNPQQCESTDETDSTHMKQGEGTDGEFRPHMETVEIFRFGRTVAINPTTSNEIEEQMDPREESILMRYEDHFGPYLSRSFAANIATGGVINLRVDELETLFLLVLEALMMPTWSRAEFLPHNGGMKRFPESSVGALFLSLIPGVGGGFSGWLQLLRKLLEVAFPEDLRLFLFRVRLGSLVLRISEPQQGQVDNSRILAVVLKSCKLLSSYFSPKGEYHMELLSNIAKEGTAWSSLIEDRAGGFNHRIQSRQSLLIAKYLQGHSVGAVVTELVPDFSFEVDYIKSKLFTSFENTMSFDDLGWLQEYLHFLKRFAKRCIAIYFHLAARLASLKSKQQTVESPSEEDQKSDQETSPVFSACWDVEQSIVSVRALLDGICETIENYERKQQHLFSLKTTELKRLQRLVFSKERERLAAIALLSSRVSGWVRMGGTHQSGQRIAASSTLWPYWAIMRKEMIVLYKAPGKHKPLDFVFLRGARLRVLEGGRSKRDLKRAFGIVEKSGKARYFTVGSDAEYLTWMRELHMVVHFYHSTPEKPENGDISLLPTTTPDKDDESIGFDSLGSSQIGKTAAALKKGSQIRDKLAGLGSVLRLPKQGTASENLSIEEGAQDTEEDVTAIGSNGDAASETKPDADCFSPGHSASPQGQQNFSDDTEGGKGATNRRLQIRGKLAGVGQVTNRWGSAAISAARQKGRQVAERARRAPRAEDTLNTSHDNSLHVISEGEDSVSFTERSTPLSWPCPKCTFLNNLKGEGEDILICDMCECPSDTKNIEFNDLEDDSEAIESLEDPLVPESADGRSLSGSHSAEKLEMRDKFNSGTSEKELFRSSKSDVSSVDEDEVSVLSDVAIEDSEVSNAAGRRSVRNRFGAALSGIRRPRFGGASVPGQDESDAFQKLQAPVNLKNVRLGTEAESSEDITSPLYDLPLSKLEGRWFALVKATRQPSVQSSYPGGKSPEDLLAADASQSFEVTSAPTEGTVLGDAEGTSSQRQREMSTIAEQSSSASAVARLNRDKNAQEFASDTIGETLIYENSFCIQVFNHTPGENWKQPKIEIHKSLSEIANLHAVLSACITDIMFHPIFQDKPTEGTFSGGMTRDLRDTAGIAPLDCIRVSGSLLAGVLEATLNENIKIPSDYSADVIMEFFNSALGCPLSSSGLFVLTEFLYIREAPTVEISIPFDGIAEPGTVPEPADTDCSMMQSPPETASEWADRDRSTTPSPRPISLESLSGNILGLSSMCISELLRAEWSGKLASELAAAKFPETPLSSFFDPLLPTHVTEQLHEAMHSALMKVMAERDEAHAQLVSASVLHARTLEQQKRKVERLTEQIEVAKKKAARTVPPIHPGMFIIDKKKEQQELEAERQRQEEIERMQQNSDAELIGLCQQLSSEISSRTQASLEVIRLKESRAVEREQETKEKDALKSELIQMKEMLAAERRKTEAARSEAEKWRQSYEKVTKANRGLP